ncbi:hypothetical protein QZH41_007957 [Actinostola sp. cb2023]|nr:hypothetical protein QZH41_007957 [Actinostola sp. cb2023]
MGAEESVPIAAPPPGFEYFIVSLSNWNQCSKIIAIFGSQGELSLIRETISQYWRQGIEMEKQNLEQSWAFTLRGYPFSKETSAVAAASAKQMMCQILQNLNNTGWELDVTSDLSCIGDLTTFYFCRSQVPKQIQYPLLCVSLRSTDKLQLVNIPENMLAVIKDAVVKTWRQGIQSEGPNENSYEIKLSGNPWISQAEESVQARLLLVTIISALAQQQWMLHAAANIKSTSDSLFFKYDPDSAGPQVSQHFVISLNNTDRLRLINAPQSMIPVVRQVITSVWMGGIQKEQDYYGSWEFKLSGNPWWSVGNESVMARFLICKILEALQSQGWKVQTSVDISRSSQDKSILVFAPSHQPESLPVMCLSFSDVDKIRLINAPQEFIGVCREILMTKWYKGIAAEEQMKTSCTAHEFKLNGMPWRGAVSYAPVLIFRIPAIPKHHFRSVESRSIESFSYEWETFGTELPSRRYGIEYILFITAHKIIAQPIRMLGYRTIAGRYRHRTARTVP